MQMSLLDGCHPIPHDQFEEKNKALVRVEKNANPRWSEFAFASVHATALRLEELTSDDVDAEIASFNAPHRPVTHDKRALGPVMIRAAKAGLIFATDRIVASNRSKLHNSPRRVWRSRIYQPTEGQLQ
jgi:hypothetical protein